MSGRPGHPQPGRQSRGTSRTPKNARRSPNIHRTRQSNDSCDPKPLIPHRTHRGPRHRSHDPPGQPPPYAVRSKAQTPSQRPRPNRIASGCPDPAPPRDGLPPTEGQNSPLLRWRASVCPATEAAGSAGRSPDRSRKGFRRPPAGVPCNMDTQRAASTVSTSSRAPRIAAWAPSRTLPPKRCPPPTLLDPVADVLGAQRAVDAPDMDAAKPSDPRDAGRGLLGRPGLERPARARRGGPVGVRVHKPRPPCAGEHPAVEDRPARSTRPCGASSRKGSSACSRPRRWMIASLDREFNCCSSVPMPGTVMSRLQRNQPVGMSCLPGALGNGWLGARPVGHRRQRLAKNTPPPGLPGSPLGCRPACAGRSSWPRLGVPLAEGSQADAERERHEVTDSGRLIDLARAAQGAPVRRLCWKAG